MRPNRQTLTLRAAEFANSQPFAPADGPDECWLSEVAISDLVDANGFLSTYGDLSVLVGPRYMRVTRPLSSDSWYNAPIVFVARQICALDDDLTAPPARAAVAAVAAVAAGAGGRGGGGRGGRGRGVGVPAVPAVAYAPMPSSAFDEDIRLGFPEWLNQNALTVELASAPRNRRNARLEMQARARYATSAVQREAAIRARFRIFLQSLTHLEQIVRGVPLGAQLGLIGRLAIELQQAPDSTSVASYQALNDEAGKCTCMFCRKAAGRRRSPPTSACSSFSTSTRQNRCADARPKRRRESLSLQAPAAVRKPPSRRSSPPPSLA